MKKKTESVLLVTTNPSLTALNFRVGATHSRSLPPEAKKRTCK
jgi:hypothetical protein